MRGIHEGLTQPDVPGGVIEPAVVVDGDVLRMWLVCYARSYYLGTRLYGAVSTDGVHWTIEPSWTLSSLQFGRCGLHYPQLVRSAAGWSVWFTLRNLDTAAFAICRMALGTSAHGRADALEQVMPPSRSGLQLAVRQCLSVQWNGRLPRGMATLNLMACRLWDGGRHYFGYAHSHFVDDADGDRMYYHGYHFDAAHRSTWMDIGTCDMTSGAVGGRHDIALARSTDPAAWDTFFVADPFVIKAD